MATRTEAKRAVRNPRRCGACRRPAGTCLLHEPPQPFKKALTLTLPVSLVRGGLWGLWVPQLLHRMIPVILLVTGGHWPLVASCRGKVHEAPNPTGLAAREREMAALVTQGCRSTMFREGGHVVASPVSEIFTLLVGVRIAPARSRSLSGTGWSDGHRVRTA